MSRKLISDLKSCLWKNTYYDMDEANRAVKKYNKKYDAINRAYKCKKCGGYHLTTKPLRNDDKKNERNIAS